MADDELGQWSGKKVLVTGGTGSIGSELVRWLHAADAEIIRVLSNDENGLFELQQQFPDDGRLRWLIGDVRDRARLERAMDGIDVVFHAAALKHVPLCEYNPFEAVQTNVIGTSNAIEAAISVGVERLVFISTDKAIEPVSTMGATKLLAERVVKSASTSCLRPKLSIVRFGNVLGSRGSLVPEIRRQIAEDGRLKLTHPDMTRFMMSIADAVRLTLDAVSGSQGGETFILRMPALRISDMIEVLRAEIAPTLNLDPASIPIDITGIRPGEKLHERLLTREEERFVVDGGNHLLVLHPPTDTELSPDMLISFDSEHAPHLDHEEIRELLIRSGEL